MWKTTRRPLFQLRDLMWWGWEQLSEFRLTWKFHAKPIKLHAAGKACEVLDGSTIQYLQALPQHAEFLSVLAWNFTSGQNSPIWFPTSHIRSAWNIEPSPQKPSSLYIFQVESLILQGRASLSWDHPDHPADKHGKKRPLCLAWETVCARITHTAKRLKKLDSIDHEWRVWNAAWRPHARILAFAAAAACKHIHPDEQPLKTGCAEIALSHFAGAIAARRMAGALRSSREDYRRKAWLACAICRRTNWLLDFGKMPAPLTSIDRCLVLDQNFGSITRSKQLIQSLKGQRGYWS